MNFKDALQGLVDDFVTWFEAIRRPDRTCSHILDETGGEKEKVLGALRLWLVTLVIHLILHIPALGLAKVSWSSPSFLLPNFVLFVLNLMLWVGGIHLALRLHRVPSSFIDTLAMFTTSIAIYTPFAQLFLYPSAVRFPSALAHVRADSSAHSIGLLDAYVRVYQALEPAEPVLAAIEGSMQALYYLFLAATGVLFVNTASSRYRARKTQVLSAMTLNFVVLAPLYGAPVKLFYGFLLYVSAPG